MKEFKEINQEQNSLDKHMRDNSRVVFSNMLWRFLERIGAKGITLVVSIVLARLLEPKVYGTVALIYAFLSIIDVFVDAGFGTALIQKKNADDIDYSSIFFFNLGSTAVLYLLVFFTAPIFAWIYGDVELTLLIRAASITILISGIKNVQQAYVSQKMLFKRFFYSTLGGTVAAAFVGIILAYMGFGVWALVAQSVINPLLDTIILWFTVRWRPIRAFSVDRIKELFSYGGRYLVALLIARVTDQLNQFFIGKVYTNSDLAYYNRGYQLSSVVTENVNSAMESVLFATLANNQDNLERVKQMTKRSLQVSCYLIMPLMMGLAVCGKPLVQILLTDKWLPCLPYLYVFCTIYALYPITISNINVTKALGVKEILIKYQILKSGVSILVLLLTIRISPLAIALGTLATSVFGTIVNAWPTNRLIKYSIGRQIMDIMPTIILTIGMGGFVFSITLFHLPIFVTLILQIVVGVIVYLGFSVLFRFSSYQYLKQILSGYITRGGHHD